MPVEPQTEGDAYGNRPAITLIEFLYARIAADEAAARGDQGWSARRRGGPPARVLAECEAKRRIIEVECQRACDNVPPSGFTSEDVSSAIRGRADTPALRALAAVYDHHPGYREEWRLWR